MFGSPRGLWGTMKRLAAALLFPVLAAPAWGQAVRECRAPQSEESRIWVEEIEVTESFIVAEVNLGIDLRGYSAYSQDVRIGLESPAGTLFELSRYMDGAFIVDALFSERALDGRWLLDSAGGAGLGESYLDCGGCLLDPSAGGSLGLARFAGEDSEGVWTLAIEAGMAVRLDEWCLTLDASESVRDLVCSSTTPGVLHIECTAGGAYDEVVLTAGGSLIATVPGPFADGEEIVFDSGALPYPQLLQVQAAGVTAGVAGVANACEVLLHGTPMEVASEPGLDLYTSIDPVVELLTFEESVEVIELIVDVKLNVELELWYPRLEVACYDGTAVVLHADSVFSYPSIGFDASYWDLGIPPPGRREDCRCLLQPAGPGSLADFSGKFTIDPITGSGAWAIGISGGAYPGTILERVALRVFDIPSVRPVSALACELGATPESVLVTWVAGSDYDLIDVLLDGAVLETFEGTFDAGLDGSYLVEGLSYGAVAKISVRGYRDEAPSYLRSCTVRTQLGILEDFACASAPGSKEIAASWTNPQEYDSIAVFVGDDLATTLPGDATSVLLGPYPGLDRAEVFLVPAVTALGDGFENRCTALLFEEAAIHQCVEVPIPDPGAATGQLVYTLSIGDDLVIDELEVLVDWRAQWADEVEVHIGGPTGLELRLTYKLNLNRLRALFDDDGEDIPPWFGLDSILRPAAPGKLALFVGEKCAGDWQLRLAVDGESTLDEWCLRVNGCTEPAPERLGCEADGRDVTLSWGNPADFETVELIRDGVLLATLAGAESSYVDALVPPGVHEYRVRGRTEGAACESGSTLCRVLVQAVEVCRSEPIVDWDGEPITLELLDSIPQAEIEVRLDLWFLDSPGFGVALEDPDGTRLILHSPPAVSAHELSLTFADDGVPYPPRDGFVCGCQVQPAGPGQLADLGAGERQGIWTFDIAGYPGYAGRVSECCLVFHWECDVAPPRALTSEASGVAPLVALAWENGAVYDEIVVLRDGTAVATLEGSEKAYEDTEVPAPGRYSYRVAANIAADACTRRSAGSSVAVGAVEVCAPGPFELPEEELLAVWTLDWQSPDIDALYPSTTALEIGAVEVPVDFSEVVGQRLALYLQSPGGTTVQLLERREPSWLENTWLTFSDDGGTIECWLGERLVAPEGPGSLADFAGEDPRDVWLLAALVRDNSYTTGSIAEWCLRILPTGFSDAAVAPPPEFRRGDANADGVVEPIPDALALLAATFLGGALPPCLDAADIDGDGALIGIVDAIRLLAWAFQGGPPPAPPGPDACGSDPGLDGLGCAAPPPACDDR